MENIADNVRRLLEDIPRHVSVVAAAKTRSPSEVSQAVEAGICIIGENFIQEASRAMELVDGDTCWHFIGHLQRNKVGKAVKLFDMIETVDSAALAVAIDKHCLSLNKVMPLLVEVNIAAEPQKYGVLPQDTASLIKKISNLANLRMIGLMTMGPQCTNPDDLIPHFREARRLFEEIDALCIKDVEMKYLSMGMSDSYRQAITAGANMVRIGSAIFGPRR